MSSKVTRFDEAIEVIGQALFDVQDEDSKDNFISAYDLMSLVTQPAYILVQWPESQKLMKKDWFGDCILANEDIAGSASYFVPINLLLEETFNEDNKTDSDLPPKFDPFI